MHRRGAVAERSQHSLDRVRNAGLAVQRTLGQQEWLDRPSYRLEHALTFLFAAMGRHRERVSNALHGTWLGHPLHPALTSVPTGAVATTVAMDAASVLPGHAAEWRDASRFALGVGLVGSVGAAATGLTDWQHTHEQSRRIGVVHGLLNAIATGLYAMSWWDRGRGRHVRGMASSALGYGLTLGSGYLGGALVFGSGTGVDRSGARLTGDKWTPALPVTALDGQPQRVEVEGVGVVLYRNNGQVLAVGEHCPHLGAPMDDGWIDRDRIVCPWHGSRFACESGDVLR
ncbi:MAG: Rieske 2Fe-2S domain-containing protein, partial [Mycobacterium sp.]|nr:Rieske 2Fe-2S domain-containing protein [Mycobacterium sp.]